MKLKTGTRVVHTIDESEGVIAEWDGSLLRESGYTYSEEYKWCAQCDTSTDGYITVEFDNGCGPEIVPTRFLKTL